jgi:carbamate kinase
MHLDKTVEAVIDKDLTSVCLAKTLRADLLVMVTDVRKAALWYGTPRQRDLDQMHIAEARRWLAEGHFPPGSMGPKVEAAIDFLEAGGKETVITSPDTLTEALAGTDGTRVLP